MIKSAIEDEGVRVVCKYLQLETTNVEELELVDNKITSLGCEFIAKTVVLKGTKLKVLKLDHNPIKSQGVAELSKGLSMNSVIESISLNYCFLEPDCAQSIMSIIIYLNSNLQELSLQGNNIQNEGALIIFKALLAAKNLEKINVSDNHISDTVEIMAMLKSVMKGNAAVRSYNLRFNGFIESGKDLVEVVKECKHIYDLQLDEKLDTEFLI